MSFNINLQSVANLLSTHADLLPVAGIGGITNEPFLSLANDALADLITSDNDWKFNRVNMPLFVTAPNKQDYLFAGACAFSNLNTSQGWSIDLASKSAITVAGGIVTVTTLEPHRFAVGDTIYLNGVVATTGTTAAYNSTFVDTGAQTSWTNGWVITGIATNSFTFLATVGQNNNDVAGAPGITNFAFLQDSSMVMMTNNSSPQFSKTITAYRELPVSSFVSNPEKVAVMNDNQVGVLTIRFWYVPGSVTWGVNMVYQAQAPVKQSLGDNWSPFPDHYSAVYRQALIYRGYRWLRLPEANQEYVKLQEEIKKAMAADDAEETSVSVQPEDSLMDSSGWFGWGGW